MDSYRCYRIHIPSTNGERIVDTITWLPKKFHLPIATSQDLLRAAINDLTKAIRATGKQSLVSNLPTSEVDILHELADILTNESQTAQIHPNQSVLSQ